MDARELTYSEVAGHWLVPILGWQPEPHGAATADSANEVAPRDGGCISSSWHTAKGSYQGRSQGMGRRDELTDSVLCETTSLLRASSLPCC